MDETETQPETRQTERRLMAMHLVVLPRHVLDHRAGVGVDLDGQVGDPLGGRQQPQQRGEAAADT
jgi:hypothetical protein